ncbi:MAG: PrsW family intramembrane metalloprotease [Georgenia sp.]
MRPRRLATLVVEIIAVGLGLTGLLWVLTLILSLGGARTTVLAGGLAVLPLLGVLVTVAWVDRWEPEPRWLLLVALVWGAGLATAVSLFVNDLFALSVLAIAGSADRAEALTAVLSAPLVEESAKGLGVLVIFLLRRRSFDGPVDGIVYAAVVAAGFAFTENVLYFVRYTDILGDIFLARAVQGPFAHVTFTVCTGIVLGLASRSRNGRAWLWAFPLGLGAAIVLHGAWNLATVFSVGGALSWLVQMPVFTAGIVVVVWLRNQERMTIRLRLGEYAAAGWFEPYEVRMLSSLGERRAARRWAAAAGPRARRAMKEFQAAATSLAFARQRALTGRGDLRSREDERDLLDRAVRNRAALATLGTR